MSGPLAQGSERPPPAGAEVSGDEAVGKRDHEVSGESRAAMLLKARAALWGGA